MNVRIVARVNIEDVDARNIHLYYYDRENNRVNRLNAPDMTVDRNEFIRFNTIFGGDIVISEGPLTKR